MCNYSEIEVQAFIRQVLPPVITFTLRNITVGEDSPLQDYYEVIDLIILSQKVFKAFNIDAQGFSIEHYTPWVVRGFFDRKPAVNLRSALTIDMFVQAAQQGYWPT